MDTLGDKIKQLRTNLTQEELASMLQVERSTLASWEINRREPDLKTLCRLASLFRVTVDWLVGHSPDKEPAGSRLTRYATGAGDEPNWQRVIDTARHYGLKPDHVAQLIELTAEIGMNIRIADD
ncbi:MAG: helix-turn-helix transcriptional regulator [Sporomusaceae bacterium]|nr:helix-turn-helix transcriptional regulator [Sporomusaceae bacterium]